MDFLGGENRIKFKDGPEAGGIETVGSGGEAEGREV